MARWRSYLGASLVVVIGVGSGCKQSADTPTKPAPPATVAQPIKESQLNTIVLTAEAEGRLGLTTSEVEQRTLSRKRTYGGEVTLPASATLTVSAPVSGTLRIPKGEVLPPVGSVVAEGQAIFTLLPHVLTQAEHVTLAQATLQLAQARIDADGQVNQAKVQVDAAHVVFERSERLYRDTAGTKKELDDAVAQLNLAQKGLDAALLRKSLVDGMKLDTDRASVQPLEIKAPRKGIVRATYAVPGQMVPAGSPLFEIVNVETVWIKVPIYVGELAEIAEGEPAQVRNLADPPGAPSVKAKPVLTPPTAQPQASAVDLYYALSNPEGKYRPGQHVSVQLALQGQEKSLGLPWSAVVHDIYGGTWVYVQTAPRTYARQRVQVHYVVGAWAVLAEGPAVGAKVVTAGAAEVFGTEFGFGK